MLNLVQYRNGRGSRFNPNEKIVVVRKSGYIYFSIPIIEELLPKNKKVQSVESVRIFTDSKNKGKIYFRFFDKEEKSYSDFKLQKGALGFSVSIRGLLNQEGVSIKNGELSSKIVNAGRPIGQVLEVDFSPVIVE